ncbi:MAG: ABC transporter permease [Fervidicoccaceae archaeon]
MGFREIGIQFFQKKEISVSLILMATILTFYSIQPKFLSPTNIEVLLKITPELGIVALGVTILMIGGELDLSVGSVFGFAPLIMAVMLQSGINTWIAFMFTLILCLGIGTAQGIVTVKTGIPSFITTLGGMLIWRGLALVVTGGHPMYFTPSKDFAMVLTGKLYPFVYSQLLIFLALVVLLHFLLERHKFGNWVYAVGGKRDAAEAMGINVARVKVILFALCSLLAGLGGIIQSTRMSQAMPNQGDGLEFDAIAAAVIGGTSLFGGVGTVIGTVLGEFLSRIIENGLIIIRAPSYYFRLYIGIVIIVAVIGNLYIQRRALKLRVRE